MSTHDWDTARELIDPAQRGLLDMAIGFESENEPSEVEFEVLGTTVDGDIATVKVKMSNRDEEEDVTLRKIDGEWVVYADKSSIGD